MTITKELIKNQIDKIEEKKLEEVFYLIKNYLSDKHLDDSNGLLSNLRTISINGPKDLSQNLDSYLRGEA